MSHKHYQRIYESDRGKGYGAVDILANISYIGLAIYGCLILYASKFNSIGLIGLLYIPIPAMCIYVTRLIFRSVFAWRDKLAYDILE